MSIEKKIFATRIFKEEKEITKRWFISVKVPDYKRGCFVWRKAYGDINKFNTIPERLNAINILHVHILQTQTYKSVQGSRHVGYVNESFYTDTVFQYKKQLELRSHTIRKSSLRRYTGCLKNLERWLIKNERPRLPVGAFNHTDAKLFLQYIINDCGLTGESYNAHLRLFKSFSKELQLLEIIKINPWVGIKGMSRQNTPALYFNKIQTDLLKKVIPERDPWLWLFVQFIYYCFIRPGELRQIRISDINFDEAKIMIRPEINKNKKMQYVSIPSQLLQALLIRKMNTCNKNFYLFGKHGYPSDLPLSTNAMKIKHQAILKELNFNIRHKLYSWKHTGAVACARAGMNLKDLQMQLRHYSLDQVNTYLAGMLVFESDFIKNNFPAI